MVRDIYNKPSRLAIVIPAYKAKYLKETLESISQQTCKDFTLYIGDDYSPEDIYSIVQKYKNKIEIVYKRFDSNLGGKNLVEQWKRCIDLTQDEEWIWLFSDDDIMGSKCVESFYNTIKTDNYDVFHFNVKEIDQTGKETGKASYYPEIISSYSLYKGKMTGKLLSLVVENIFSRNIYKKTNGFQNFDLAWGSDTATWIKFCSDTGMKTIYTDYIYWRISPENITPTISQSIVERKLNALIKYLEWNKEFFSTTVPSWKINLINLYGYIARSRYLMNFTTKQFMRNNISTFAKTHHMSYMASLIRVCILFLNKRL